MVKFSTTAPFPSWPPFLQIELTKTGKVLRPLPLVPYGSHAAGLYDWNNNADMTLFFVDVPEKYDEE